MQQTKESRNENRDCLYADQVDVAARLASAGFPVLDLSSVTASQLMSAVREVTSLDPDGGNEYREKARRVARIYRAHGGVRKAAGESSGWFEWSLFGDPCGVLPCAGRSVEAE